MGDNAANLEDVGSTRLRQTLPIPNRNSICVHAVSTADVARCCPQLFAYSFVFYRRGPSSDRFEEIGILMIGLVAVLAPSQCHGTAHLSFLRRLGV
jgi:hypothetical protein